MTTSRPDEASSEGQPRADLPPEVATAVARLQDLVDRFELNPDPAVQERVVELLQCVDGVHRPGLRRIAELLRAAGLERRALDDPEVRLLYELYDLDEEGPRARAEAVVASLREPIESIGGRVELAEATATCLRVRLIPPAGAAPHVVDQLHGWLEATAREALPDVASVEVESTPAPPRSFVPLASLERPKPSGLIWRAVLPAEAIPEGEIRGLEVDGESVLVAHVEGEYFGYRNACPGTPLPLHAGVVEGHVLTCPWHRCRFDLRGGRCVEGGRSGLGVLPLRVEAGQVRLGIAERAA